MKRYSPSYHSPARRGYGGRGGCPSRRRHGSRGRSPPRRGYDGQEELSTRTLMVRNIPLNSRPEDLRIPFEIYGQVQDLYLPKDYHTGKPRGFAFVQFAYPSQASDALYNMDQQKLGDKTITVFFAKERKSQRKWPNGGHHHSRTISRSRFPDYRHPRDRSRSHSPAPRHRGDYSVSRTPNFRHPRDSPRSHSPSPRRGGDCSVSSRRRQSGRTRSPRDHRRGQDDAHSHR